MDDRWVTRKTLLQKVKDPDSKEKLVWDEFVSYYKTFIEMLLAKWNFPVGDRDDIVQDVLLKLWKALPQYEYREGKVKFRTWLNKIIKNSMLNFLDKKNRRAPNKLEIKEALLIPDEESEFEKSVQEEWDSHLLRLATDKVREVFSGQAYDVFQLSLQGKELAEIAKELGITEASVYTLRSRFKSKLIHEIKVIRHQLEN